MERVLINLSNHPYDNWSERQKHAAIEYGKVIDLPFPLIDETADELYIEQLAKDFFGKIINYGEFDLTVHIMGELTFTFALLKLLQKQGVRCIASTSKRIVKNEMQGVKEEVIFQFFRFREYL